MPMQVDLQCRDHDDGAVVLVTGSARRTGRIIARNFARSGARVMITSHSDLARAQSVADEISNEAGKFCAAACLADVATPEGARELVATTIERFGSLDVLVNNAGLRLHASLADFSPELWRQVMSTVLDGAFFCAQAAAPHLVRSGRGAIVNIGGISSQFGSRNNIAVVTAKAGIVGLTRALATELGPSGVTVNCVVPGTIIAEDDPPERSKRLRSVFRADRAALGRTGTPEEVASAVVSLCSPAWRYVTGQVIHVNGGVHYGAG